VIRVECDTGIGNAVLVSCDSVNYGLRESKIMETHGTVVVQMKHIYKIDHSSWVSKALLTPKPQQETSHDITFFK
jgi:hypothetical protein